MNVNMQSVIKAAAIGAIVNGILAVLGGGITYALPAVVFVTWLFSCCGGVLIPVATGALYGFFTPGKETLQQSAMGGAISGAVAGLAYGIIRAIMTLIVVLVNGTDIGNALTSTGVSLVLSCCGLIVVGLFLGAIGGVVWTAVQKDK